MNHSQTRDAVRAHLEQVTPEDLAVHLHDENVPAVGGFVLWSRFQGEEIRTRTPQGAVSTRSVGSMGVDIHLPRRASVDLWTLADQIADHFRGAHVGDLYFEGPYPVEQPADERSGFRVLTVVLPFDAQATHGDP